MNYTRCRLCHARAVPRPDGLCGTCRAAKVKSGAESYGVYEDVELGPGEWVPDGLILRWVPAGLTLEEAR